MKRFKDPVGMPYSVYAILSGGSEIIVKCAHCEGPASIRYLPDQQEVVMRCSHCLYQTVHQPRYAYSAAAVCTHCERWFNQPLHNRQQFGQKKVHFPCPYCHTINRAEVRKQETGYWQMPEIHQGRDPYFGLELYFMDYYRGQQVWALNREHLSYLLDYISADLRENSMYFQIIRTASHPLPKYMKEAKNRDGIVRLLRKMQNKRSLSSRRKEG